MENYFRDEIGEISEMETAEDVVKRLIISRYASTHAFSNKIGLPNSTVVSIMNRGFANAGVSKVIRICDELRIDLDALAEGKVIPKGKNPNPLPGGGIERKIIEERDAAFWDEFTNSGNTFGYIDAVESQTLSNAKTRTKTGRNYLERRDIADAINDAIEAEFLPPTQWTIAGIDITEDEAREIQSFIRHYLIIEKMKRVSK